MHQPSQNSYSTFLRDVFQFIKAYRSTFIIASLIRLSADIVFLYSSYKLSNVLAYFAQNPINTALTNFWPILIVWGISHIYFVGARHLAKYLCYQVAERMSIDSSFQAIKHASQLDIVWHERENTGNKLKRIQNGGEGLKKIARIWIDNIIQISVNFIGMIAILAFIDVTVALIMTGFLLSYILISLPLSKRVSIAARTVNQSEEDFSGLSYEILNNIRSVKVMGMFERLFQLLQGNGIKIYETIKVRTGRFHFKSLIQNYWAFIFRVITIIVIIYGITEGRYEISFLILFNFYFKGLSTSIEDLSNVSPEIMIARYNIARLKDILNEPIRIDDDNKKVDFPAQWQKISLKNVSFSYGDHQVLRNVSFDITRGEKLGIVGLSGAGKSTLFKLLLKEHEDFTGDILFDSISIRQIKKSSYFQHTAIVLQETEVFNFSLKENITITKPEGSGQKKRLDVAIQTAHVNDFIYKLPQGINTLIGEKGIKLSGGEKQRVGIARAVFKEPDILFLDEATSHLDLESEEKIKDSLHQFFQSVTAIVIAHRLTTIQEMDRILLIEDGALLESGNFKSLHKKHGRFFELWSKQKF
jgi:ABC-type multidrug transport system fused ATPase/permease subunit